MSEIKNIKTDTPKEKIINFFSNVMGMPNAKTAKSGIEGFLDMIGNDQITAEKMRSKIGSDWNDAN